MHEAEFKKRLVIELEPKPAARLQRMMDRYGITGFKTAFLTALEAWEYYDQAQQTQRKR